MPIRHSNNRNQGPRMQGGPRNEFNRNRGPRNEPFMHEPEPPRRPRPMRRRPRRRRGCYIATCAYGSYNCPEVWVLRRYRDYALEETWYGRLFISIYYAISPTIVKIFGNNKTFKNICLKFLDNKVKHLKELGYQDTEYNDLY